MVTGDCYSLYDGRGEGDLSPRIAKKPKHIVDAGKLEMVTEPVEPEQAADPPLDVPLTSWASKLFTNDSSLQQQQEPDTLHLYLGEDEEEPSPGVDELFLIEEVSSDQPPKYGPRVEISKEKYISLFKQWRGALILKLLGRNVNYKILEQKVQDLWQLELGFELTDLAEVYYVVRFYFRSDYLRVLEGGPWIVLGHYLMVFKWRPKFRPHAETVTSTLVWVRFPNIPPELLEEENLSSMGDMIGRTIKVDSTSLTGLRGRFARVCVEVDLAAPLIPSLTLLDFAQPVEYMRVCI